ncbi:MAG: 2-oxo acid dehydrogenase subunit E2 [Candidatus Cloacimonetes bacterium]|jgi:pyruvate dehydrogenase E2 component (dihydrolipoamide acetyltransferase)|nr:2-oxo acid dehydrogenase subunit E2 [Candidatus Cloacimonadota bacterium]MCK9334066.1 2-oxo acid dehydrogenase subunit E2 [Candidatus Cloacimonadota bacterium]MDD4033875.1 dihydrolipoamide acetyltransferase family protein [Candidatus Cloacimonadota bacterium]MDD4667944.1 dihydrolipoamide acetyltransferase family protein [Candidatus Cloacimonadota bacterium]MDY0337370.1 dihydrolipoamide acetyltransferase family protein [Candidatus Cloacimonadaceae bacterium]
MRYIFKFPDIGEGLEEGKIIEWYVQKGQNISSGDPLVKMETDKVVTDIPSPKSGVIAVTYGGIGDTVKVGNALVEIDIEGVEGEAAQSVAADAPKAPSTEAIDEKGFGVVGTIEVAGDGAFLPAGDEGIASQKDLLTRKKALATPVARAMAKELGIDINQIPGSGPAGRVTKKDITENASKVRLNASPVSPQAIDPTKRYRYESLSTIRKTIAKNMLRSKQNAAHMSVMDEVEVSELVAARKRLNEALLDKDMRLSYLPFIIKAVARALKNHPVLNAELDLENERIIYKNYVNIGIAMDADEGLVVPVIRDADHKSLIQVARDLKDLIDRAKERKLTLEDLKDGSFSITSYGSIGGYFAVPVINYPQVAIFGVGRMTEKPIVKDSQIAVGNMLPISMSVDHRIVDGGEVARFLNEVLGYLRDPLLLLAFEGGNHGL